jgi:multicomponent Na+:H+ antiporter subunit G
VIQIVLSNGLIAIALAFMVFGLIGIYRFKHFFSRILVTSNIEIAGFIILMIGIMIRNGLSFFSLKVALISLFVILTNPISTMAITRAAHRSSAKPKSGEQEEVD